MVEEIINMVIWGLVTATFIITKTISIEFGYLGMCIMMAAGLLHNDY